jgi:hypothetical protein
MSDLFASPLGALLAKPWLDQAGLLGLRRWYMPLSRLWAAANAAGQDVASFRKQACMPLPAFWSEARLLGLLQRHERVHVAARGAREAWEAGVFGTRSVDAERLDTARRQAATRHMASRGWFYPLLFPQRPPVARWTIDPPGSADCEEVIGSAALDPATIEVSQAFERNDLREYWLRAVTPSLRLKRRAGSETLYARVVEPANAAVEATLIFGSGLGLEFELLTVTRDAGRRLAERGWRVVEPVSAYHGLRAMPGFYGGEPFYAAAPSAALDLVVGQAIEAGLLTAWLRSRHGGKVALAGISMTSFVVQRVASACHLWPAEARPDAAMLISHAGCIEDATFGGALSAMLGLERALADAGWTREALAQLSQAIDPAPKPALSPSRIVSVLGETDRWLPFDEGLAVARRWELPEHNLFRYRLGHLGMPIQLARDMAPFERLRQVLAS